MESGELERRLETFLDAVDQVVALGVSDHLDVRRVVQSADPTLSEPSMDIVRAQLSAVLARNPEELAQIADLFDRCVLERARPLSTPGTQPGERALPPKLTRRWPWVLVLMLISLLPPTASPERTDETVASRAVGGDAAVAVPAGPRADDASSSLLEREVAVVQARHVRLKGAELALTGVSTWRIALVFGLSLIALRALLASLFAARAQRKDFRRRMDAAVAERRAMAEEAARRGSPQTIAYAVPTYNPLAHPDINELATRLGRMYDPYRSSELDPELTVRATIDAGGRFVPVAQHGRGRRQLVALVDVEASDHPWLGGIGRILGALEQLGTSIVRYNFRFRPGQLEAVPSGAIASFDEVARRHGAACVLVVSRRLEPWTFENEVEHWVPRLNTFPRTAWIDPDPSPVLQTSRRARAIGTFEEYGLPRFPCTAEGWLSMARYLSSKTAAVPEASWPTAPSSRAIDDAVQAWALTAALVPDATWDQLEAIRRSQDFPEIGGAFKHWHHLQCLLDWVESKTHASAVSGDGRCLALPESLVDELIKGQRLRDQRSGQEPLELRARKLLLSQLDSTCPTDDLWGALCWQLKRASHQLVVDPEQAKTSIGALIGTPVEPMLIDVLRSEAELAASGHHAPDPATAKVASTHLGICTGEGNSTALGTILFGHHAVSLAALVAAAGFTWVAWTLHRSFGTTEVWVQIPEVLAPKVSQRDGGVEWP